MQRPQREVQAPVDLFGAEFRQDFLKIRDEAFEMRGVVVKGVVDGGILIEVAAFKKLNEQAAATFVE